MKAVMIILACWVGLFAYGILGVGLFILFMKHDGRNWKEAIHSGEDDGFLFGCIVGWPLVVAMYTIVSPVLVIAIILDKVTRR